MSGALAALAVALAALALVVAACGTLGRLGVVSVLVQSAVPAIFTDPATQAAPPTATHGGTSTSGGVSSSSQPGPRSTPVTAPSVTASANATAAGTPSPAPTGAPTATAPASPTGTPVPSDGPSTLSIDRSSFSFKLCSGLTPKATQFTVKNSGGGTLDWTATTAAGYTISPSSGTLAAGAFVMVDVTKIAASGQITVTAPGASGSPGFVSITCTVL
jgi:hypothetical protein